MASAFIDTNIFIAFANKRDRDHVQAVELFDKVRLGEFGVTYTSDCIFDEAVTTALVRTRRQALAVRVGKMILGSREESIPPPVTLIMVDERVFEEAWRTFKEGRFEGLSFTDHTILAQLKEFNIDTLISFDRGFDGLTRRVP